MDIKIFTKLRRRIDEHRISTKILKYEKVTNRSKKHKKVTEIKNTIAELKSILEVFNNGLNKVEV